MATAKTVRKRTTKKKEKEDIQLQETIENQIVETVVVSQEPQKVHFSSYIENVVKQYFTEEAKV